MTVKITDEDRGFNEIIRKLKLVPGKELVVGVLEPEKAHPRGSTVGMVALAHEFGLGRTPARPFIRATFDANEATYMDIFFNEFKDYDIDNALEKLGRIMVQNIKFKIMSYPLYDTGTLVHSIGFEKR